MGEARDWGTGLPLKASLLGKMNRLEVHHVFPKSVLYKAGYRKSEVNALANFCFLTKDTNLQISNRLPEEYFKKVESEHPGALSSQWIPADPELWSIAHFREFLEARKELLAAELNHRLEELLHGENHWLDVPRSASPVEEVPAHDDQDIADDGFVQLNDWVKAQGIPEGIPDMELSDPDSGEPLALLDLAWPLGLQEELSQPVAALGFDLAALEDVTLTAEELSHAEPGHAARLADAARRGGVNPEEPGRRRAPAPADVVRATLSVPVTLGDEAVAYLCLHSFEIGDAFDDQAREFVQLFANELAALFGHGQLQVALGEGRARLERFVGEYRALADFSAEIETIHDPEELIEYGMEHLLHTFRFDTAMFTELRGQALHFTRVRGAASEELSQALVEPQPLGAGINGRVAASGEPLYVEGYASWPSRHEPYVATGVLSMLALPIRRQGQVLHTLAFATIKRHAALDYYALRIARGFVKRLENAFERAYHLQEIKATREATFRSLGVALEYRDLETRGHTDRVVSLARCFADAVGLDPEQRQALAWGAYLHDLGKLAVPDAILLKPAKLTAEEFAAIRRHTLYGVEMVRDIAFLPAETVAVVRSHHERWDGGGYPDGLAGGDIPLLARMFSLVDVYDALTSERPYKRAWTHADAVTELQKQAGSQFDPHLVPLFLAALTEAAA